MLWLNYKTLQVNNGSAAELLEAEKLCDERLHNTLAKLSGNLASTVRDAQGRMSQVTTAAESLCLNAMLEQRCTIVGPPYTHQQQPCQRLALLQTALQPQQRGGYCEACFMFLLRLSRCAAGPCT